MHVAMVVGLIGLLLAPPKGSEIERNKAVAHRVFDEILNGGRYGLFDELYSKDFVKHVDRRLATLAQEIEDAKGMRIASSDLVMSVDAMIAEGDMVAILYTGRGTNTGPFQGMPPTGRKLEISGMTLYRFSNGRIAEEWATYNMLEILRQLGLLPEEPPQRQSIDPYP